MSNHWQGGGGKPPHPPQPPNGHVPQQQQHQQQQLHQQQLHQQQLHQQQLHQQQLHQQQLHQQQLQLHQQQLQRHPQAPYPQQRQHPPHHQSLQHHQPLPQQPAPPYQLHGQQQPYPQPQGHAHPYRPASHLAPQPGVPDPDKGRRIAGFGCLLLGCLLGGLVFILELGYQASTSQTAAVWSVILAFVPVGLYLTIPYVIDRYDPEPWWALAGVFLWGALFATGVSGVVNTIVAQTLGQTASAVVSAPIVEELTKGMAVFGIVFFLRREFDGIVDGIIYGTFAGIGFAAVENVGYYFNFRESIAQVFILRGVLSPWLHPLFTSMTGLGFGLGREKGTTAAKVLYPIGGYGVAVLLHAIWNGTSTSTALGLLFKAGLGICLALVFIGIIIRLVVRKGRTLREYLQDEVLIGTMSQQEVDLVCSPFGRIKARMRYGSAGRDFVRTAARLSLSKWHTARAMKGKMHTISADFIGPYRRELMRLREDMAVRN